MTYRAVGFDYDGVLKGTPWRTFEDALSVALGIEHEQFKAAFTALRKQGNPNLGELRWPDFWQQLLSQLGDEAAQRRAQAVIDRRFSNPVLNADVLAIAQELKAAGCRIGVLSNNEAAALEVMQREGLADLFAVIHISALTGAAKPTPEAFGQFAAALGVDVRELVFTDDNANSLRLADEIGFTPILFTSAEQLRIQLGALGVLRA